MSCPVEVPHLRTKPSWNRASVGAIRGDGGHKGAGHGDPQVIALGVTAPGGAPFPSPENQYGLREGENSFRGDKGTLPSSPLRDSPHPTFLGGKEWRARRGLLCALPSTLFSQHFLRA